MKDPCQKSRDEQLSRNLFSIGQIQHVGRIAAENVGSKTVEQFCKQNSTMGKISVKCFAANVLLGV
jgi:hypothetical protein